MRVLIIHGWGNHRPPGHWHRLLAAALRTQGHVVAYPQLPDTDSPTLPAWLAVVKNELDMLAEVDDSPLVVVAHSLGCLTWIQSAVHGLVTHPANRVLLVAPADPDLCGEVPTFQLDLSDAHVRNAVHKAAHETLLVASDADPWTPRGITETFARPLNVPAVVIPGAGHIAIDDGWGPWQGVIDWVNEPEADLQVR